MKSIRTKIMLVMCALVVLSLFAVGGTATILTYTNTLTNFETTMSANADLAVEFVKEKFAQYELLIQEIAQLTRLTSDELTPAQKGDIVADKGKNYGFLSAGYIALDGTAYPMNVDYSGRDYFIKAKNGSNCISEAYICSVHNVMEVAVASPVMKNGAVDGIVFFAFDIKVLSDITDHIRVGKTGRAFAIDAKGYTIAHSNYQIVLDRENTAEEAKTDSSLKQLGEIETKMARGETGTGKYVYNGVEKIISYAPVNNGTGWSIGIANEFKEITEGATTTLNVTLVVIVIAILLGVIVSFFLSNAITLPVRQLEKVASDLSEGYLGTQISYQSKDELGRLSESMRQSMAMLGVYIANLGMALDNIARGNFDIPEPDRPFIGEFKILENNVRQIIRDMSMMIQNIRTSAQQVTNDADQVANGSQSLAQGAAQQAASVEELSAALESMQEQFRFTGDNIVKITKDTDAVETDLHTTYGQMQALMHEIQDVNSKSAEISKIIKTIQDIAFQTNILALNASVEAARVGSAGEGFAVVAGEVRDLAAKSAKAAKSTASLIESTVSSIANVAQTAETTVQTMDAINSTTKDVAADIRLIAQTVEEELQSMEQIVIGVDQISIVVQMNSETSEESAAASQELSLQANLLNDMMSKFKVKEFPMTSAPIEHSGVSVSIKRSEVREI